MALELAAESEPGSSPLAPPALTESLPSPRPATDHDPPSGSARLAALFEVVLCSGYPTQLTLGLVLAALGWSAIDATGGLSLSWVIAISLADAVLLVALIVWLLRRSGDRPADVFLGSRPLRRELAVGLPLVLVSLGLAIGGLTLIHAVLPGLRNVPENPLQDLLRSPLGAVAFTAVAIISGALREEVQRAFILHRFEQHLGGGWLGLVLFSLAFGLGHQLQGWDAAIVTGLLGGLWGAVYLLRRSIVSTVVAHAGFNVVEIALALAGLGDGVV